MRSHPIPGLALGLLLPAAAAAGLLAPLSDGTSLALPAVTAEVPAPDELLGYPLGTRFTHWAQISGYLERLAVASPRVAIEEYGRTWEGRPLLLVAISSPANLARLDELRERQLRLAAGGEPAGEEPVVVWLAYGVHGNEASSAEAAVAAAYLLAAAGDEWEEWLERTLVLIDPLANPDGRERYVHFFESRRGRAPDPLADAAEHWEPWPGGRPNHYLIDLNRDWAWATQPETRGRLAAYRRWEPQVFVDFHEMGPESTYFFPPAAQPIHPEIGSWTSLWAQRFGAANAAAFDRYGWIYYSAEDYDLFYPGYGDSYPCVRGAVGMTYEMAGHGRAGEALRLPDGRLLTLADRIARHLTTSLAAVATAAANHRRLVAEFAAGRRRQAGGRGRSYLWQADQPEAAAAAELLALHGVEVGRLDAPQSLAARPLAGGPERQRDFSAGAWVVSARQPLGALVRALMEPDTPMPEKFLDRQRRRLEENQKPEFYDITAWSLPLAYNLEVWSTASPVSTAAAGPVAGALVGRGKLGYLVAPQGLAGFRLAAALLTAGLRFRFAVEGFSNGGRAYPAGTLFVPRVGNPGGLEARLEELARRYRLTIERTATAFSPDGGSLGSERVVPIRPPRVALVGGSGVSATSYGALWHLLDRDLELSHHRLETRTLSRADLSQFDVLILPAGFDYERAIDGATAAAIGRWVESGGLLVAVGGAVSWLRRHHLTDIAAWAPEHDGGSSAVSSPAHRRLHVPGAALATAVPAGHPLAAGLAAPPPELFLGREILLPTGDGRRDVLRVASPPLLAGFAWPEAVERLEGSLLVGIQPRGHGAMVLFAQEPAFRLFWRAKLPLFLNAVMFGPSLNQAGWLTLR